MQDNKKAPSDESNYDNIIIEQNNLKSNPCLTMPALLEQTVTTLKEQFKGCSINSIINITLAKYAQMFTAKRIKYKEFANVGYPNYYSIVFMPSGAGKDRISDNLDNHFFKEFRTWFKDKARRFKEECYKQIELDAHNKFTGDKLEAKRQAYIEDEQAKIRNLILEVSNGTPEGFFTDAKAFQMAGMGSLFMKISELGVYLSNAKSEQKAFITQLFEAYSGKIVSKCTKGGAREADIENLPVSALLYSDPTMFERDLKTFFNTLMHTGLGRRSVITFMNNNESYKIISDAQKALDAEIKYYNKLEYLGAELFKIFMRVESNTEYVLTDDTFKQIFHPYKIHLKELTDKQDDALLNKEINSRELKVLKLSCLYACINHPNEHFINPIDMQQAINTIEMLSNDFKAFINHKPKYDDKYDRIFNYFVDNLGKEFKKSELTQIHFKEFGISRDKFRSEIDSIFETLKEMASAKGYYFKIEDRVKNATIYSLHKFKKDDYSNPKIADLKELINSPPNR